MGLFGKAPSREPAEETHSSSDEEDELPPPYPYGQAAGGSSVNDSKASIASSDGKNDHIYDLLEEVDANSVWLDALKTDQHGSSIVRRGTQDVLYTLTAEKRWTKPTTHMFRGSVPQLAEERSPTMLPFASIGYSTIRLRESPDQVEATKFKRKEIVKMPKWYGM